VVGGASDKSTTEDKQNLLDYNRHYSTCVRKRGQIWASMKAVL
jgi:hypothetical protein